MSQTFSLDALKEAEKTLGKGGGGKFVRLDNDETKDIRILEPTPSMNGLYYIEVPIWWINGKPVTSPEFLGEGDYVQTLIDGWKKDYAADGQAAEAEFKKLMAAKSEKGAAMISKATAYWIPILEFEWKLNKSDEIVGIYTDTDEYDVDLIKGFIKGNKVSILDAKVSLVKSINKILTTGRGAASYLNQEDGVNMRISRAGRGRDTVYSAQKDEVMPMPDDFYGDGTLDPVIAAKSSMFTNDYIAALLDNYFDGAALPEDPEYRFPELRDEEEPEEEQQTSSRRRRGATEEKTEKAEPASRRRGAKAETEEKTEPATRTRRKRDLASDVANSE